MTPDKAIELNKESERSLRQHKFIDHADAVALGNEALKYIEKWRDQLLEQGFSPLPGEDS